MDEKPAGGCVVCGDPVSPKDGIRDRCGHHRRQLLRNLAKRTGLPSPTKSRGPRKPRPPRTPQEESPLEFLTPAELKAAHARGDHTKVAVISCVLCIRKAGGSINHVERFR